MYISGIYRHMLGDRKYGLTHNLIATKVMPTLIPHTVCPGLTLEQVSITHLLILQYYIYIKLISVFVLHILNCVYSFNQIKCHKISRLHTDALESCWVLLLE